MHCAECSDRHIPTPAVAVCQDCGRALCADCGDTRPGPGGMNIGCRHGGATAVTTLRGLRIAARAAS